MKIKNIDKVDAPINEFSFNLPDSNGDMVGGAIRVDNLAYDWERYNKIYMEFNDVQDFLSFTEGIESLKESLLDYLKELKS